MIENLKRKGIKVLCYYPVTYFYNIETVCCNKCAEHGVSKAFDFCRRVLV